MIRNFIKYIFFFLIIILTNDFFAQWAYDPKANTPLVVNPKDPTNISVIGDSKGGGFIVWQDIVSSNIDNIFFLHFNKDGLVSFRSDGKAVSLSQFSKSNPIAVISPKDEVIILWKEIISSERQNLTIQKVNSLGSRLWTDFGVQLERVDGEINDFDLSINQQEEIFITMISRDFLKTKVIKTLFKLNSSGNIISKTVTYQKSDGNFHSSKIISNDSQTAGLFWVETEKNKSVLKYTLSSVSLKEHKEPIIISNPKENVLNYSVSKVGDDYYVVWTVLTQNRRIYHQLLSSKGQKKWGTEGKLVTTMKGSNYNPKHSIYNNRIVVTWVNEFNKDKNIYVDAFDLRGERVWDRSPLTIINLAGDQFGQQIVSDEKGGFIIAWIDRRKGEDFGNIYAQKITLDKKFLWDSTGVDLGTSPNSQKSYLNLIDDKTGGAIAVFKDKRENVCEIYGQKIFATGTYAGQILGLKSELLGDSIKISWYVANEPNIVEYDVLRKNEKSFSWKKIGSVKKISSSGVNYYEYFDFPDESGQISYRIVQKISGKEHQQSDVVTVNYSADVSSYVLFQNSPNPFSDKTNISFLIPYSQQVEIEIFDVRLNPIKILVKDYFSEGRHTVTLNSDNLPSGIYFYRMKAGDFIAVKKMVINK